MLRSPFPNDHAGNPHVKFMWLLASIITSSIFLVDLQLPLGVAGGVPYVAVILIAWWLPNRSNVIALAIITSLLTVIGYVFSPPGGTAWIVITNRGLALFAIWSVAILIIQRKPAEAMLREASNKLEIEITERVKELSKLSVTIEQSPVSIVITNPEGTIEYVNPQFTNVSGYSLEEAVGQNPRILNSEQNDPKIFEEMWNTLLDGQTWRGDLLNKNKSGEVFWENVSISPITANGGEIINFVGIKEDITERKRAEEELAAALKFSQEAETVVRDAIESISEGFVIYDKDDRMVICNENYKKLFPTIADIMVPGGSFEELIDVGLARDQYGGVTAERDKEEIKKERMEHHNNPTGIGVNQQMADGRWMMVRERRTSDGGIAGIRADITEIKRVEEAVGKSEQKFRQLIETASEGVWEVDGDAKTVAINPEMLRILDRENEDLIGRSVFEFVDEKNKNIILERRKRRADGELSRAYEIDFLRPNGSTVTCLVNTTTVVDEDGGHQGAFALVTDITVQKEAEDELNSKMKQAAAFNKIAVGRELKMIELKKEINELYEKAGEPIKYQIL